MTPRYAEIEAAARAQGWQVSRTRRGHRRLVPADKTKPVVIGSSTPSDHRGPRSFLADARRCGLIWPPQETTQPKTVEGHKK